MLAGAHSTTVTTNGEKFLQQGLICILNVAKGAFSLPTERKSNTLGVSLTEAAPPTVPNGQKTMPDDVAELLGNFDTAD
jgi:hypothetical protein